MHQERRRGSLSWGSQFLPSWGYLSLLSQPFPGPSTGPDRRPSTRKHCGVKCTRGWMPQALVLLLRRTPPNGFLATGHLPPSFSMLQTPFVQPTPSGCYGPAPKALCLPMGCQTLGQGCRAPSGPLQKLGVRLLKSGGNRLAESKENSPDTPEPNPNKASEEEFAFLEAGMGTCLSCFSEAGGLDKRLEVWIQLRPHCQIPGSPRGRHALSFAKPVSSCHWG